MFRHLRVICFRSFGCFGAVCRCCTSRIRRCCCPKGGKASQDGEADKPEEGGEAEKLEQGASRGVEHPPVQPSSEPVPASAPDRGPAPLLAASDADEPVSGEPGEPGGPPLETGSAVNMAPLALTGSPSEAQEAAVLQVETVPVVPEDGAEVLDVDDPSPSEEPGAVPATADAAELAAADTRITEDSSVEAPRTDTPPLPRTQAHVDLRASLPPAEDSAGYPAPAAEATALAEGEEQEGGSRDDE